jgi:putative transposase
MPDMVAVDFLAVSTIRFKMLFVFVVLSHDRRRVVHFNVTANPTAQWTAQQIIEAFPSDGAAEAQHRNTYFEIETESLVICFSGEFVRWVSRK